MGALFDFSFTRFAAPAVAKIVYILLIIVIALGYVSFVVGAFATDPLFGVLALLVLGPLGAALYLVLARVALESLLATIYTAQNTGELVRMQAGGQAPPPGAGPPPGQGPPPHAGPPPGHGPPPPGAGPPPGQGPPPGAGPPPTQGSAGS